MSMTISSSPSPASSSGKSGRGEFVRSIPLPELGPGPCLPLARNDAIPSPGPASASTSVSAPPSAPLTLNFSEDSQELIQQAQQNLPPLQLPPMTSKPWFVVATKADLDGTQDNFLKLREYLLGVQAGMIPHPSGKEDAWRERLHMVPISGIRGEGVARIPEVVVEMLDA